VGLPRLVVVLLAIVAATSFGLFVVVSLQAYASGSTFEYVLYGYQFPYAACALLAFMAGPLGLLWFNYRNEPFRGAEELIYGSLFGVSAFGFVLSVILALLA
jgi:hypothetical protein